VTAARARKNQRIPSRTLGPSAEGRTASRAIPRRGAFDGDAAEPSATAFRDVDEPDDPFVDDDAPLDDFVDARLDDAPLDDPDSALDFDRVDVERVDVDRVELAFDFDFPFLAEPERFRFTGATSVTGVRGPDRAVGDVVDPGAPDRPERSATGHRGEHRHLVVRPHRVGQLRRLAVHPHTACAQDRGEPVAPAFAGVVENCGHRVTRHDVGRGAGGLAGLGEEADDGHRSSLLRALRRLPLTPRRSPTPNFAPFEDRADG